VAIVECELDLQRLFVGVLGLGEAALKVRNVAQLVISAALL
jgi:hypothetical protein